MGAMTRSHEDLAVWKTAMQLAADIYRFSRRLPKDEQFGLQSQLRRAAVSVPSNIAEGAARSTSAEFRHFLSVALGSLAELETQYLLCIELGYSEPNTDLRKRLKHTRVMLSRLRLAVSRSRRTPF